MKKIKLFIIIAIILTLFVASFTPIVYAVDEANNLKEENTTENQETNETVNIENMEEKEFQNKVKEIYGEPVILINGQINKDNRLDFSNNAMPQLQLKILKNGELENFTKNTKKGITVLSDIDIKDDGTFSIKKIGSTVLEFAYKYPSLIIFSQTRTIKKVNIWISEYNPVKYNITLDASVDDTQKGFAYNNDKKLVTIEKGKITNSFKYENGTGNLLNDVLATVEDESIAKIVDGVNGSKKIEGISVGETRVIFTGDSIKGGTATFTIKVVENLYQYDNSHEEDVIPDDFNFTQYDEREDVNTDYTKLNEELLKNTDTLEVTVEGDHVVKADVFKTLKKYPNKKLLINSTASGIGKISWIFDSNSITNYKVDFKPSAEFSAEKLENIHNDKTEHGIFMELAHNGVLPGKASVSLWLGEALAEKYIDNVNEPIYLYYYNSAKKDYEYVGDAKMIDYGTVGFELEHCSIYLLSTEKLESKTTRPLDNEPKTGTEHHLIGAIMIAVMSLAGIVILNKYKFKNI